jgi:hypothetical protein
MTEVRQGGGQEDNDNLLFDDGCFTGRMGEQWQPMMTMMGALPLRNIVRSEDEVVVEQQQLVS